MSILSQINQPISTEQKLITKIHRIKLNSAQFADQMFNTWKNSFDAIWKTDQFTPAQKIEALGTDAAELYQLSAQMVEFMITIFTGRRNDLVVQIQAAIASLPAFEINQDGTVTLL